MAFSWNAITLTTRDGAKASTRLFQKPCVKQLANRLIYQCRCYRVRRFPKRLSFGELLSVRKTFSSFYACRLGSANVVVESTATFQKTNYLHPTDNYVLW